MSQSRTLIEWLDTRATQTPKRPAYRWRDEASGRWSAMSWDEVRQRAHCFARQLCIHSLRPGDTVVMSLPVTPDWECCHYGILAAGGIVVGVDAHDADDNIRHILETVRPAAWLLASSDQAQRFAALGAASPRLTAVASGEPPEGAHRLADLLTAPSNTSLPEITPKHHATIIFTSGSTGTPKGIAYTHGQLSLVGQVILDRFPEIREGARLPCWLPLSNLFQRVINLCGLMRGAESWFVANPAQIIAQVAEIRPALLIGVPRFFEKLHAGILTEINQRPWLVRRLALMAWDIGCRFHRMQREGNAPGPLLAAMYGIAELTVLARMRALMGADLQFMVSGSAPMPPWLLERFHGLGWLVLEAYGISENALPIALNTPKQYRFGSVGRPLEQNELRIADDSEVQVRGPTVFGGYWNDSGSGSPLDAEGFLHTGDLGRLDDEGYLWLTGRKSEIFKTSTGRRIAPAPIEACLKTIDGVEHAVVFGRDRPFPVTLLCIVADGPDPRVLEEKIAHACAHLPEYQRPAGALLTRRAFTIAEKQLTANLKLRRQAIEAHFADEIDTLYRELGRRTKSSPTIKVVEIQ